MTATDKARDFFEQNDRFNFYVYDRRNEKVGASVENDTLEQATSNFEKILSRLEAGNYYLKAKKPKGDASNSGLIRMDFTVSQSNSNNKNSGVMSDEMLKMIREDAYNRAKFDLEFAQMKKDVEEFKLFLPLLRKLSENQKELIKAFDKLLDDNEENDDEGLQKLNNAKDTVVSILDALDTFKK